MADRLLVSFATRPDQGGEAGVGWNFALHAGRWCQERGDRLTLVLDARDVSPVAAALRSAQLLATVTLVPVQLPFPLRGVTGSRRSRFAYLAWAGPANRICRRLARDVTFETAHQVTFATVTLPTVLAGVRARKTIWGPLAVPTSTTRSGFVGKAIESVAIAAIGRYAKSVARLVDMTIATNAYSQRRLGGPSTELEPNIFLQQAEGVGDHDHHQLVICGLLIERKRPWLAIRAMADPRLSEFQLSVVGDGPMLEELRSLAREVPGGNRITFHGRVHHAEAQSLISTSRLLLHPSAREGAAWVIGEADSAGVPSVVTLGGGAESTVDLCENKGTVARSDGRDLQETFNDAIVDALQLPAKRHLSQRWRADRIPKLLDRWWATDGP